METTPTLSEHAYRQIRDMVLRGQVAPGQKLLLEPLAARVGMGTTPLREALSRLATEGLVIGQGQRGYRVPAVSADEYRQITDLRQDLETKALLASISRGGDDWEVEVIGCGHRLSKATALLAAGGDIDAPAWERHNRAFHMALVSRCANPWLLRFVNQLFDQSERYRYLGVDAQAVPLPVNDAEHAALMKAALDRRADDAARLLHDHIGQSAARVIGRIFGVADAIPAGPEDGPASVRRSTRR